MEQKEIDITTLPIVITLKRPVQHGADDVREIVFNRPMIAKDMYDLPLVSMKHGDIIQLVSRLSGLPRPVIDRLSPADYSRCAEVASAFLSEGQETQAGV